MTNIVKYETDAEDLQSTITHLSVDSHESYLAVGEALREVKSIRASIKEERFLVTKPQREALASANDLFDRIDAKYAAAEAEMKTKMALYDIAARAVERARIEAATDHTALALIASLPSAPGITMREYLDFEITDPTLVPRELCEPSTKAIRALVKASKGARSIPGVRIFTKQSVAARVL